MTEGGKHLVELTVLGGIMLIVGLFQSVIIPTDVEKKIIEEMELCDGQLIKFEQLSYFKEIIYDVEYKIKDEEIRKNIRYHLFSHIEWL